MNAGDVLETRTFTVTRADLVAYAEASGDHNPIHQDEDVARSVGLPGVIAHGMYTLALVGRAVAEWTGGAEVVDLGAKFTSPVVVPAEGGAEVVVGGTVKSVADGLVTLDARGDVRGQEGARHAQGRGARGHRPCLTCATTPPCAWVAPAASGCEPPPRPSSSPRWRTPTPPAPPCCCWRAGPTSSSRTRASTAGSWRSRPPASTPTPTPATSTPSPSAAESC